MAVTFLASARKAGPGCLVAVGTRAVVLLCVLASATTVIGAGRSLWFVLSGKVAEGVVVRQAEELTADWQAPDPKSSAAGVQTAAARRVYRAIVEFRDGTRTYQVEAQARGLVPIYALGSKVDVVYPAGRPARAQLRPELPDVWSQAGLLLMGTMLGSGAAYWWWKLTRRRATIIPLSGGRNNVSGG